MNDGNAAFELWVGTLEDQDAKSKAGVLEDVDGDGDLDLSVFNDESPDKLYSFACVFASSFLSSQECCHCSDSGFVAP